MREPRRKERFHFAGIFEPVQERPGAGSHLRSRSFDDVIGQGIQVGFVPQFIKTKPLHPAQQPACSWRTAESSGSSFAVSHRK